jgi:hypothetical protein
MDLSNKEAYLISQGRSEKTINFVKSCNVSKDDLVWFVTRLEKDQINIEEKDLKSKISKISRLIKASPDTRNMNNFKKVFDVANRYFEDESDIESRKLYKFKDGTYILNLSEKELDFEGNEMSNCVGDYKERLKRKDLAILAVKDKKDKTLAHFEVNNLGLLRQHYGKANSSVKYQTWKYINDFFQNNKDEKIFTLLKEKGFSAEYNLRNFHKNLPIVEYYIPISRVKSVLSKKENVGSMIRIKDFINTDKNYKNSQSSCTAEEAVLKLKEYAKNMTEMIESMSQAIIDSSNNLFILNDNIIQKIFNKKINSSEEKLAQIISIYSGNQNPMHLEYEQIEDRLEEPFAIEVPVREELFAIAGAERGRVFAEEIGREEFMEILDEDNCMEEICDEICMEETKAEIGNEAPPIRGIVYEQIRETIRNLVDSNNLDEKIGAIEEVLKEQSREYEINEEMCFKEPSKEYISEEEIECKEYASDEEYGITKEVYVDLRNNS